MNEVTITLPNNPVSTQAPLNSVEQLTAVIHQQDEKIQTLEHQLNWFKRQLFGEKSEKQDMTDNPFQHTIAELLKDLPKAPKKTEEEKQTISYERGKAKKNVLDSAPDDSGLRFDEGVPVEEINILPAELKGPDADDYEIIGHKTTYRLAQRPGSQVILKYTRPVIKKKSTQKVTTCPAPRECIR